MLHGTIEGGEIMIDLSTTYLGLKLKNPLVASASPLSEKVETVKKLEEAGDRCSRDVFAL